MDSTDFLRRICRECGGSVVISECSYSDRYDLLCILLHSRTRDFVHTIAGLAIVTVDGWAAVS